MINQMNYVMNIRSNSEDRIRNGIALLKTSVNQFNLMLEYSNMVKKHFIELYTKVKQLSKNKETIPVSANEVKQFRGIEDIKEKDANVEVAKIGDAVLFTETLHNIRKKGHKEESPY